MKKAASGIKATITAFAPNQEMASTAAHVYFGKMTDVLSYDNDIPIMLTSIEETMKHNQINNSRRRFEKADFKMAFDMSRKLKIEHPRLLRAIGWFSKGKISQNTLDKFLAFWNVIEITGKEYHTETDRTNSGTKNKIYQCFIDRFGPIEEWELPDNWIDEMYDKRNEIVHGGSDTTVEAINVVSEHIALLEQWSRKVITKIIDENYS